MVLVSNNIGSSRLVLVLLKHCSTISYQFYIQVVQLLDFFFLVLYLFRIRQINRNKIALTTGISNNYHKLLALN